MSVFNSNPALELLESKEEWYLAKKLLYTNWLENKNELDNLLRLGTECWYIMSYWEQLKVNNLERSDISSALTEVKQYGKLHFSNSETFLWIFGYMIKLFPYWFDDFSGDLEGFENLGRDMIIRSLEINPNNEIAKMLCSPDDSPQYIHSCSKVKMDLNQYFPGNSAIEQYFRGVWS